MSEATTFSPRAVHASLPWVDDRLILLAYHVDRPDRLCQPDINVLQDTGFALGFQLKDVGNTQC